MLLLAAVLAGPRLMAVYRSGARVDLLGWAGAAGLAMIALGAAWRWFNRRPLYDLQLVQEKLSRPAARTEVRLTDLSPF